MNWKKYKMPLLYILFGGGTTLVNLLLFQVFYYQWNAGTIVSNIVAWVGAVLFAFATNKWFVFESKSWHWQVLARELASFFGCRGATGLMDLALMYVLVDLFHFHAMFMKLLVNILVVILNYIASKVIFKQK